MSLPWSRGRSSPACRRDSWPICGSRPPSCPLAVSVFILASSSAPIPLSIASDLDSRVLHSKSRVSVTFYLFKWHCILGGDRYLLANDDRRTRSQFAALVGSIAPPAPISAAPALPFPDSDKNVLLTDETLALLSLRSQSSAIFFDINFSQSHTGVDPTADLLLYLKHVSNFLSQRLLSCPVREFLK